MLPPRALVYASWRALLWCPLPPRAQKRPCGWDKQEITFKAEDGERKRPRTLMSQQWQKQMGTRSGASWLVLLFSHLVECSMWEIFKALLPGNFGIYSADEDAINSNWCPKSATVPLEVAWTKNIFQARFSVHFKMMAIVSENPVPGSWALLQWSKSVLVAAAVTASKREKNKNYNEKRPAKCYICSFFSSNHKLQLNSPAFCFSQVYGLS